MDAGKRRGSRDQAVLALARLCRRAQAPPPPRDASRLLVPGEPSASARPKCLRAGAASLKVFPLVKLPGAVLAERLPRHSFIFPPQCCASFDPAGRGSAMLMWRCLALVPARPLGWYVTFRAFCFFRRYFGLHFAGIEAPQLVPRSPGRLRMGRATGFHHCTENAGEHLKLGAVGCRRPPRGCNVYVSLHTPHLQCPHNPPNPFFALFFSFLGLNPQRVLQLTTSTTAMRGFQSHDVHGAGHSTAASCTLEVPVGSLRMRSDAFCCQCTSVAGGN